MKRHYWKQQLKYICASDYYCATEVGEAEVKGTKVNNMLRSTKTKKRRFQVSRTNGVPDELHFHFHHSMTPSKLSLHQESRPQKG
jgi:hypothetical protein